MRAAALAIFLGGCCCFGPMDLPRIELPTIEMPTLPSIGGPPVELGTVAYPSGTPVAEARRHVWSAALSPPTYAAGYALSATEASSDLEAFHDWADSIGYRETGDGGFVYRPSRGCMNGLVCAQRFLATRDRADLQPLAALFLARAQASGWNAVDLATLVLAFAQEIEYRLPEGEPFGILPPATVASRGWGDCDSKSVLAVVLMQEVGIDAVLLESQAHRHGAVGIAVPATGTSVTYEGTRYAYGETTARGWPIGRAPPEMLTPPNDWTVERIPREEPRASSGGGTGRRRGRRRGSD